MHPGVYVVIAIFILIIVLGIFWQRKLDESKETVYIDLAYKFNLEIHTDDLRERGVHITGKIDDWEFEIKEEAVGFNNNKPTIWTYFRFKNSPFNHDFQILCDNWAMKIAKALGYEDVVVGNPDFDKKYICHSKNKAELLKIMSTEHQHKLLTIYEDIYGMFENKTQNNIFEYVYQGRINRLEQMEAIERILDFMRSFLKEA